MDQFFHIETLHTREEDVHVKASDVVAHNDVGVEPMDLSDEVAQQSSLVRLGQKTFLEVASAMIRSRSASGRAFRCAPRTTLRCVTPFGAFAVDRCAFQR